MLKISTVVLPGWQNLVNALVSNTVNDETLRYLINDDTSMFRENQCPLDLGVQISLPA